MCFRLLALAAEIAILALAHPAAAEASCTGAVADKTDLRIINADPKAWLGRCVMVEAIRLSRWLYADRATLLEVANQAQDADLAAGELLLRPDPSTSRKPVQVEVVGVVDTCAPSDEDKADEEAYAAAHPDEGVVITGDRCLDEGWTFLRPVSIRRTSADAVLRFTEEEVAVDQRELVEPPADAAGLEPYQAAARALMKAVRDGDEPAFTLLRFPILADPVTPDNATWQRRIRARAHTDFGRMQRLLASGELVSAADGAERSLVYRALSATMQTRALDVLVTCWCKDRDCTGRWPVMGIDLDNLRERPYVCVSVMNEAAADQEPSYAVDVRLETEGFAEP